MNLLEHLLRGWNWNPIVLVALLGAATAYGVAFGSRGRPACFAAALLLVAIAFLSPMNLLATGVLFSAHMAQHILLLLLVPALVLLSLPKSTPAMSGSARRHPGALAAAGWLLGVGSMWFWHIPQFCDAAATSGTVHTVQTVSLLAMGSAFWWPILAPRAADRLPPGHGIAYLVTACLACTGLGILLTLTPVEVCPVFAHPTAAPEFWANLRSQLTARRDQEIGGLLMWLPMCLVYVAAIILELARWLGEPAVDLANPQKSRT